MQKYHQPNRQPTTTSAKSTECDINLILGHYGGVVVQYVAQYVAAHAFARLIIEVLEEWWKMLQLKHSEDVIVRIHRDLQEPGQLFRHRAAGGNAAQKDMKDIKQSQTKAGTDVVKSDLTTVVIYILKGRWFVKKKQHKINSKIAQLSVCGKITQRS